MPSAIQIPAKAVLFDYGNTLEMDPFNEILEMCKSEFEDIINGYDIASATHADLFLEKWKDANKKLNWQYASHFNQEEPFIQHALRECGLPAIARASIAPEILAAYREFLSNHRANNPNALIVRKVFLALKEKKKTIGIVSNDREWAPAACMQAYDAYHLLDKIYTSEELGVEKPDPEVFRKVCEDMKIEPRQLCYVGDDPVCDIQCPKQLGINTVLYVPPGKYKQSESWRDYNVKISERPDAVIENLEELLGIIQPLQ